MSDIFISYASQDRDRAREVAAHLEKNGHSVWWDRVIPPGRVFDEVIQEALEAAACVVVLWSTHSVRSNWVKVEAEEASARGVLLPVLIENVTQPMPFKRIQAANLTTWDGTDTHPEFRNLLSSVGSILGRPPTPAVPVRASRGLPGSPPAWSHLGLAGIAGAAVVLVLVGAIWAFQDDQRIAPDQGSMPPGHAQVVPPRGQAAESGGGSMSTSEPSDVPSPRRHGELINLVAPENGGEMLTAQQDDWAKSVDGDEATGVWVYYGGKSEAVFGFKDGRYATVEGVEILVPGASKNNVAEFEVLVGNDSPTGQFQSVTVAKPQNILIVKERYQRQMFSTPVTARYVKVRVLKPQLEGYSTGLNEWRLLGTLH